MKKIVRFLSVLLTAGLLAAALTGCSGGKSGKRITLLNTKGEIQADFEKLAKTYEEKTGVKVEITAAAAGASPFATISSMYNSGNPPTMAMLDTTDVVSLYAEKALDLSEEKWAKESGALTYPIEGKVYSFPMGVEGKGLIYNKTVLSEKLGREFDPKDYNTYDKFKALLAELASKGMATPVAISKEDWSLGAHFFGTFYEAQSETEEGMDAYIAKLKKSEGDVAGNERFTQLLDTFDLMREYNISKADPLSADYAVDPSYIVQGKVGFWYNGNWAWPNMKEFVKESDTTEYGIMPLPLGNDSTDYVNNNLIGSGSKQVMIDKVKATAEEQQMAKDFLNWLVYDAQGQKEVVETLNLVPAFPNNTLTATDPLSRVIQENVKAGRILFGPMLPSDHWSVVGAGVQQYLAGKLDRAGLAGVVENYWKGKA